MSKNENDVLDSLLDSLSDDKEMEKKIDEFARNKERARRIQRARETSAQFQQTYSRSHLKNQNENEPADAASPVSSEENMPTTQIMPDLPEEVGQAQLSGTEASRTQEVDIPEFISQGNSQTVTIPLNDVQENLNQQAGDQTIRIPGTDEFVDAYGRNGQSGPTMQWPQDDFHTPNGSGEYGSYPEGGYEQYGTNPYETNMHPDATRQMPVYGQADFNSYPDQGGYPDNGQGYNHSGPMDATRQMPSQIPGYGQPDLETSQTRVFDSAQSFDAPAEGGGTVRVSNDEIRSLLDKEEPILKREYIKDDDDQDEYEEDDQYYKKIRSSSSRPDHTYRKRRSPWKGYAFVCGIVLAAVLLGAGGMMIKNFIDSSVTSVTSSDGYKQLMDWVNQYNSYDDAQKKDILNFRRTYEKLSEEDKAKIDDALVSMTGKTFDELLAAATQSDKPQSSNENIANAEKKAKIRDEISTLQNEIETTYQPQLDSMNSRISSAETDYNNKNAAYTTAQGNEANALNTLNYWQGQLANIPSDESLQAQILSLQNQLESLDHPDDDDDYDDSQSSSSHGNGSNTAEKVNLQAQIFQLQSELKNNPAKRSELQDQVDQAQAAYSQAQQDTIAAKQEADTAYGAWQAIKNDAQPIQDQIDQRNQQISKLQSELESID